MNTGPALRLAASLAVAAALATAAAAQSPASATASIDKIFAEWTPSSPGCAVGVGVAGKPVLAKAYGMADLEHDVRLTPDTVFEAGSVSKQFTAAAVLLLAREGKLSLEEPVRKYVPEVPDYGVPLTIRHMLNHTSGLRDWGSVASIAGWARTTRVHTHAHVLDIVSRQTALNFTPGTRYSYSNTGYNLAAVIVSRVSGMPFAEFSKTRIFQPLGMTRTSWRDDYTRIVKDRAIAYEKEADGFHTLMPFENVHGNGGLLTTVGDLLRWNENFVAPTIGDKALVDQQQEPGRFNDNRAHGYALGLMVGPYKGVRQVAHSGTTAGYSAYLARYPEQHLSVAVLCNVATNATNYAHAVADVYLGDALRPPVATSANQAVDPALYRHTVRGIATTLRETEPIVEVKDEYGTVDTYQKVEPAKPTVEDLRGLVGTYASADAEATLDVRVEGQALVLKRRPDDTIPLTPIYADAFRGSIGTVIFRRDAAGRPTELSVIQDRVWDMRFQRKTDTSSSQ